MRNTSDRIRHAIGFEVIGLLAAIPFVTLIFGVELHQSGAIGILLSVAATIWNYVYNLYFDKLTLKMLGGTEKSQSVRVIHALGFETELLVLTLPVLAWMLGTTLLQAFVMDIALITFYLVYAYLYNLAYDKIFPLASVHPETSEPTI